MIFVKMLHGEKELFGGRFGEQGRQKRQTEYINKGVIIELSVIVLHEQDGKSC
jgi:hypothetical protein